MPMSAKLFWSLFTPAMILILAVIIYLILVVDNEERRNLTTQAKCKEQEITHINPTPSSDTVSLLFLAAARNAMEGLPFFLSNMTRIKKAFPNTRLVVIENNSTDGTREYIQDKFPSILPTEIISPNFKLDSTSKTTGKGFGRITRMVGLRNQLLSHVDSKEDDYVIIIDPDWNVCIETEKFQRAIEYMEEQKKMVAASFPLFLYHITTFPFVDTYFDTFAFKSQQFPNVNQNMIEKTKLLFYRWPKDANLSVDSAFGTFGIYRVSDLKNIKYTVQPDVDGNCKCEHLPFNEAIKKESKKDLKLLTWFKMVV